MKRCRHLGLERSELTGAAFSLTALLGIDPSSVFDCLVHGLAYFIPLYITVFVAGIIFEIWFASKRGHEVNEGYFVTSILFTSDLAAVDPAVDGGSWRRLSAL